MWQHRTLTSGGTGQFHAQHYLINKFNCCIFAMSYLVSLFIYHKIPTHLYILYVCMSVCLSAWLAVVWSIPMSSVCLSIDLSCCSLLLSFLVCYSFFLFCYFILSFCSNKKLYTVVIVKILPWTMAGPRGPTTSDEDLKLFGFNFGSFCFWFTTMVAVAVTGWMFAWLTGCLFGCLVMKQHQAG